MKTEKIQEGSTELIVPEGDKISKDMPVFFNEEKALDRTLSVIFVETFYDEKIKLCDLLAGGGARGLRILNETSKVKEAYLNDANPRAVDLIRKNAENLGVASKVKLFNKEAREFLYTVDQCYNYIDVDPFGSPLPFFKAAISRLDFNKGVVSITATDVATLMGRYPKTCLRRYQSHMRKLPYSRELGLRVLIKKAVELAAQSDLALRPIFSHYHRHYYRTYLEFQGEGAGVSDKEMEKLGFFHHCPECFFRGEYELGEGNKCPLCGAETKILGPLWLGELSDKNLIEKMFGKNPLKILERLLEENKVNKPFYYHLPSIGKHLKKSLPKVKKAVEELNGVRTHFDPEGIKTNKNIKKVKEIF